MKGSWKTGMNKIKKSRKGSWSWNIFEWMTVKKMIMVQQLFVLEYEYNKSEICLSITVPGDFLHQPDEVVVGHEDELKTSSKRGVRVMECFFL